MNFDLRQVIFALADTLDLVGVDEVQHGKRVGYMADICGTALGLDGAPLDALFHAGLLHDCGVSSTRIHQQLITEFLWKDAEEHCRIGERLLTQVDALAPLAPLVRYHHTPWSELGRLALPPGIALHANLIFLLDRVDALAAGHLGKDLLLAKDPIRRRVEGLQDSLFAGELVELFVEVAGREVFWMMLEPPHLDRYLLDRGQGLAPWSIGFAELRRCGDLFAAIVDAKSRFTARHSHGVARLARMLAEEHGLDGDRVELAGLLHDLGKLRIPDVVLEKPGPLNALDRATMLRHSFETYQILRRIQGLEDVALWAAYHHETPDGKGYPFHRRGTELDREARIIAAADIFQALAQRRPYRPALALDEILELLERLAAVGRLDQDVVSQIMSRPDRCWELACDELERIRN